MVSRLGASADADDVLQETFLRLARNYGRRREVDDPTALAFAVARNEVIRWLESRRRRGQVLSVAARGLFAEASSDDAEAREAAEAVALTVARPEADDRDVVELKTFSGLTFRENGEALGRPVGMIATRYRAALARMRARLPESDLK